MPFIRPAVLSLLLLPSATLASTLDIVFDSPAETSESQLQLLSEAEQFWETVLPGYQPGIEIENVTISVGAFDIDGESGRLAQAGPIDLVDQGGFILPTGGFVDFDLADLEQVETEGTLFGILLHEVAHVLGFGTLWEANDLYAIGSGEYTGANAVEAYRAEFDPTASFVPAELDGEEGTRDAHWDETWAGGENELMTGFIDPPLFLSETTVASFIDLGYVAQTLPVSPTPVPLPAGIWMGLSAVGLLGLMRGRRRSAEATTLS